MPFSHAPLDRALAALLPLLGAWILLSALDDLILLGAWLIARFRGELPRLPNVTQLAATDHRRIAIFVPCWKESEVIAGMLRHNLAAIGYDRFAFFVGAVAHLVADAEAEIDSPFSSAPTPMTCPP